MKFIPLLLLLVLLLSMWLLPTATPALGMVLIVVALSMAFVSILMKHRTAYRQGKITRAAFVRSTFLDVLGILLAVVLAALLSRYVVGVVTRSIAHDLARLIAGILAGLLVGMGVGLVVNRAWRRLVKTSPES
jgi:hypothetical protein